MPTAYPDINIRFVQTRVEAGYTQEDMAQQLKINLSTVKAIEAKIVTPNIHIIRRWHKVFKKSYDWIIEGK
jgi:DNA-binding XRE family transcriptional regulator